MYIIDDRTPAGQALSRTAEILAGSGKPASQWPRMAAELLDLQWKQTSDQGDQAVIMTSKKPETRKGRERIPIATINVETRHRRGGKERLYTARYLARQQPVGRHSEGRVRGLRDRIADRLGSPTPRRLGPADRRNPVHLMMHTHQVAIEAVMRMATGMRRKNGDDDDTQSARLNMTAAVVTANKMLAENRASAATQNASQILAEIIRCKKHERPGVCTIMMDGSHKESGIDPEDIR